VNCPGSETIAAHADGRLEASESALLLEHCAECDSCRRELGILVQPIPPGPVPAPFRARAVKAITRSLARERDRSPLGRLRLAAPRPGGGPGLAAAAAVLLAVAGMVALVLGRGSEKPEPARVVRQTGYPTPPESPLAPPGPVVSPRLPPAPPEREAPRAPEPSPELRPADPKAEDRLVPAPPPPPEPLPSVPAGPRFEETRPEETPARPSHTVLARTLGDVQLTDVVGVVTVKRRGAKESSTLPAVARLGEGDVLSAPRGASFQIEGRHPVVLGDATSVSVAFSAPEQAPWIQIRTGEATVDSTGPTHWIVSDGRVSVVIKQARARFSTSPGEDRLRVACLSEPLVVQPDGGQVYAVHAGEELQIGRASAEVRPLDREVLARKIAAFDAARPRTRTIFYTSCDPVDANRGHFFLQEGSWFKSEQKNEALLARDQKDKTVLASIAPNPRFTWREGLVLRFRFMTNIRSVELALRVDERRYTLTKTLPVDRRSIHQWIPAEVPLAFGSLGFRRDDGQLQLTITTQDHFDALRFGARQQDVYDAQKAYLLVDDIQVVEKEKE